METRALSLPTSSPIDTHVSCHACGYDLFALHQNGLCPECGVSIGVSINESIQEPRETSDPSATFLKVTFVIVAIFASVNLLQANHDPSGICVYFLIWLFLAPVSLLTAFLCGAQGKLSWALYWIGMTFVSFVAVHLNGQHVLLTV